MCCIWTDLSAVFGNSRDHHNELRPFWLEPVTTQYTLERVMVIMACMVYIVYTTLEINTINTGLSKNCQKEQILEHLDERLNFLRDTLIKQQMEVYKIENYRDKKS